MQGEPAITPDDISFDGETDLAGMGVRIRELVDRSFRNLDVASRELGVSPATLHRYMGGATSPNLEFAVKLCSAAGASVNWLATGRGDQIATEAALIDATATVLTAAAEDFPDLTHEQIAKAIVRRARRLSSTTVKNE